MIGGILLALLAVLSVTVASDHPIQEGDRVCVEYVDADGYFCGPIIFTKHDDVFHG